MHSLPLSMRFGRLWRRSLEGAVVARAGEIAKMRLRVVHAHRLDLANAPILAETEVTFEALNALSEVVKGRR